MYLEMIFGKNKEQTTRQLQFKFDPLPTESAEICLFHERWIKTFYTQIIVAKLDQINFLKYQDIFNSQLTKWLGAKSFDPPLVKKTNFRRFSWKRVKFELHLPHSLLFIFSKNHFQVHKYLFNQINTKKNSRFNHQLGAAIPAILSAF